MSDFVMHLRDFVLGILSWGFCSEGFCPGGFVLGDFSGGILSGYRCTTTVRILAVQQHTPLYWVNALLVIRRLDDEASSSS